MTATPTDRPKIAVVIGSGGIKCAAAVGLWKVLEEEGVPIDLVVGCSGGSIYAAGLALGYDFRTAEAQTRVLWNDVFTRYDYRAILRCLLPGLFGRDPRVGLIDDRRLWEVLKGVYGDSTFADGRIPLFISTTDLGTGERVVLREGRLADAVRASVAMPLVLRPWQVGDRLLFDGGASDPLPVSVAIQEGADIILAMGFESPPIGHPTSLAGMVAQTITISVNNLLRSTYAFYSAVHHAEIIPILPHFERRIGLRDTDQIPYLIEQGEIAARAELPYLRRLLARRA